VTEQATPSADRGLSAADERRLESWKEIAAYLKRDVRTVQRWERREGLPVHRQQHEKLASVYAYKSQIDAWRRNGHEQMDNLAPEDKPRPVPRDIRERGPWRFTLTGWWYAGGLATLVVLLAAAFLSYRTWIHRPSGSARRGKFSWLTTLPGAELAPAFSPDGKTIAFAWRAPEGSGFDLYKKTIGSDEVHRLTWRSSRLLWPAWSPDGRKIAFLRGDESEAGLFLISADGGVERKLLEAEFDSDYLWQNLSWSSTGKFLVYPERFRGDSYRIVLFSLEDSQRRALTNPPAGFQDVFPAFSPEGQRVAFYRCFHADCKIYTINVDAPDPKPVYDEVRVLDGELAWTHDGEAIIAAIRHNNAHELWRFGLQGGAPQLVYSSPVDHLIHLAMSPRENKLAVSVMRMAENIWRFPLSQPKNHTAPDRFIASSFGEEFPQYSPDGKHIAFQSIRSGTWEVWECDGDGSNSFQLTHTNNGNSIYPRWSPDSRQIAYDTRRDGHSKVFLISAVGETPQQLDTEELDAEVPGFSPDGQWVYFAGRREKSWQIWKVPRGGGTPQQVTQDGGYSPVVSSDYKWVYYTKGSGAPGIWRVSVNGGSEQLVVPELEPHFYADWALVPTGLYFVNAKTKPTPAIQFYDFASRRRVSVVLLQTVESWSDGLAVSPDNRWLLFPQVEKPQSELMLIEDL